MAFFWFDESVHSRGAFALGAFVSSLTDQSPLVARAVYEAGLEAEGEFKSGAPMANNQSMQNARD